MQKRILTGATLGALSALWPTLLCAITHATMSPLERALSGAICGEGPQTLEFLGHCLACWSGAAAFAAAALLVALAPSRQRALRAAT
ncbi:MAG: hypothetical protein R3C25_02540 [Hyphomonadaceae bacterium]